MNGTKAAHNYNKYCPQLQSHTYSMSNNYNNNSQVVLSYLKLLTTWCLQIITVLHI